MSVNMLYFCSPNHDAGWSSPVARWAHNPKVGGSNPPPATKGGQQASFFISPQSFFVQPARYDNHSYRKRMPQHSTACR